MHKIYHLISFARPFKNDIVSSTFSHLKSTSISMRSLVTSTTTLTVVPTGQTFLNDVSSETTLTPGPGHLQDKNFAENDLAANKA